jgi:hypothetical protein
MSLTLALALTVAVPGPYPPPDLAFRSGRLTGWEGSGFYVTTSTGMGPSLAFGVCSSDRGPVGRTGLLHRTFVIPPGTAAIRFSAAAVRPPRWSPGPTLDVVLEAPDRQFIARQEVTPSGNRPAPVLLPAERGRPREYVWNVAAFVGQTVRIALIDEDNRPGCYLLCSGFRFVPATESESQTFVREMRQLERAHRLNPMARQESKHFLALSNADEAFTEDRLYNCEIIYELFFDHFRKKGFAVREPAGKLMVAIFDSQSGFEACLGSRPPSAVTGTYNLVTNRLIVYDFGQNRTFLANKQRGERAVGQARPGVERQQALNLLNRRAQDWRTEANIGTIVHEVAHQLSFNCGLLNRQGDVPLWLAEGLACYCEATDNGAWQGIGEANPHRAATLAGPVGGKGKLIPLRDLLASDDWLGKAPRVERAVLGYAQSWALFGMLLEEKPRALRRYLELVGARRTAEHRLADFVESFGDLTSLEANYRAYLRAVVARQGRRFQ